MSKVDVSVYYRGKSADKVWKKVHGSAYRYKTGSGTNLRTGEQDVSFYGPCSAMQKIVASFRKMKGVRVKVRDQTGPVKRLVCSRKKR